MWSFNMKNSIWDANTHCWIVVEVNGMSGGILCSWDRYLYDLIKHEFKMSWIWCEFKSKLDGNIFQIINVYSPQEAHLKRELWEQLGDIATNNSEAYICIIGDFNVVRGPNERANCIYRERDSVYFNEFINNMNLMDMMMNNSDFTWFGPNSKKNRLDRCLVNYQWQAVSNWKLQALSRKNSDHKAILLAIDDSNWGPLPFRDFNQWLKDESLVSVLDNFLDSTAAKNQKNVQKLLRGIKEVIKDWHKDPNNNIDEKIKRKEELLNNLDGEDASTVMVVKTKNELEELYLDKVAMLKQKSRIQWNLHGDKNSKFYHQIIQKRRLKLNKVDIQDAMWLDRGISGDELDVALQMSSNEKAPGPNGMSFGVVKYLWKNLKPSLLETINVFSSTGKLPKGFNSSFIAFIPKVDLPKLVTDFRPISLINSTSKLFTNILANRLGIFTQALVSESQFGFIKERHGANNILMLNELCHNLK
ncbi:hypothetical protein POM88_038662 [Heracleum sosnowskyi]|uniref:Reverse transcriptase domain-containing protein n=1 Tax=Heracleum sosnowskyi TaxID=360622 RepID=A0AAD8HAT5_9APIA|nr:hypothetical protein POM88_038662 [Heracleum sosnowskyi]